MPNKKQVLIIDISALFHRAWHALPPLTTPSGEPISAIYGLANLLLRVLAEIKPDYALAAVDTPVKTFRHEIFPEYKATRPEPPDDLKKQFSKITDLLFALKIPMLSAEGFEADDVIGTVAASLYRDYPDLNILILSSDRDVWQLINDRTAVLALKKGVSELQRVQAQDALNRFGAIPERIPDFKALAGDSSDNIAGIRGLGDKSAHSLLSNFGSLEGLYDAMDKGEDKRIRLLKRFKDALLNNKSKILTARTLATIRKDAPVVFSLDYLAWKEPEIAAAKDLFTRWGFLTLIKRLQDNNNKNTQSGHNKKEILEMIENAEAAGIFSSTISKLERDLVPIFDRMTQKGILIDPEYLRKISKEFKKKKKDIEIELFELAKKEFNPASSDQVRNILVGMLGNQARILRKTTGGKSSTAFRELKRLETRYPFVEKILAWREIAKLLSTYIDALPKTISPADGRIHSTFLQLGTSSGRISSMKPNLQNIPIKSEYGRAVRKAFIAPKGRFLLSADYSQIELRVIAHLSGDRTMIDTFLLGQDIHVLTASKIFHVKIENVTPDMRSRAKTLNFGILYGMGSKRLAEETDMNHDEARDFIAEYFGQFPDVATWIQNTKNKARELGFAETMFGRKRFIPEALSPNPVMRAQGERAAVNMPIQGTAADIMKFALLECTRTLEENENSGDMLLQVHDEILFEINQDSLDYLAPKIIKAMTEAVKLKAPLEVSVSYGSSWGDMLLWKK